MVKAMDRIRYHALLLGRRTYCVLKKNYYVAGGFMGIATGVFVYGQFSFPQFSQFTALNDFNKGLHPVRVVTAEAFESKPGRWIMFKSFASLECGSEIYMTPSDFVRCSAGYQQSHVGRRTRLTESERNAILDRTPKQSSHTYTFTDLGTDGLISFPEYVFLTTLLKQADNSLKVAFRMFDRDGSEAVDIIEFTKIIQIFNNRAPNDPDIRSKDITTDTTLLRLLFGKSGKKKIYFSDFSRFINDLKADLFRVEYKYYTSGQALMTPLELSRSLLRHTNVKSTDAQKAISRLQASSVSSSSNITFDAFRSLFEFLFQLDDFSCALNMFRIARRTISKDDFQRAVRAVTGVPLDAIVLDTIFVLFDSDGDNHLDVKGFVETVKARRSVTSDPLYRFSYWPRYVARLLRVKPVYRREYMDWKFQTEHSFLLPKAKPNEYAEERFLPVWRFTETAPWNTANRLSEFPYPDLTWCVVHEDGRRSAEKLRPISPEEQLIFKGDRVSVLVGPDKGRVGIVSGVLKVRRLLYVDSLNYRIVRSRAGLQRELLPLKIDTEVALLDPEDNKPCSATWRYTETGERVRVSVRSGRVLPLPASARQLDDLTDPATNPTGEKDTPGALASKVTFDPTDPSGRVAFEKDLTVRMRLEPERQVFPTYWY